MSFLSRINKIFQAAKHEQSLASERLLEHVNKQLKSLADTLEQRIEQAARQAQSVLVVELRDLDDNELQTQWQDVDYISRGQIETLDGFKQLKEKSDALKVRLQFIDEEVPEADDQEQPIRFIIRISGWG